MKRFQKTKDDSGRKKPITRRRFIRDVSAGAAGIALASSFPGLVRGQAGGPKNSTVVIARHPDSVIDSYTFDQSIVGEMVNAAIGEFTGQEAPGLAWAQIFPSIAADSRISIKVNCINGACSSHPEVAYAIAEGLASIRVGGTNILRNNIIIWDRSNGELSSGGYTTYTGSAPDTVRCYGTPSYDSNYGFTVQGSTYYPSSIFTQDCDYLINLAVLKNHGTAGVTLGLKNHLGSMNSPGGLHGGSSHLDLEIPELNQKLRDQLDVYDKEKITIIDSLVGIRSGGPGGSPQFSYGGIILGTDPVATDYVGRDVLADSGCTTTGNATHIETADTTYGLGTSNPVNIDLVEHDPIAPATREHVDKMISFHKQGLATERQVQWAVDRYDRGL